MSIPDIVQNINSGADRVPDEKKAVPDRPRGMISNSLFTIATFLSLASSAMLGFMWQKVNLPSPIAIQCSDEVLTALMATSASIPLISKAISTSTPKKAAKNKSSISTSTKKIIKKAKTKVVKEKK